MFQFFDKLSGFLKGRPRTTLQIVPYKDQERALIYPHPNYSQLNIPTRLKSLDQPKQLSTERSNWRSIVANMQLPPQLRKKTLR